MPPDLINLDSGLVTSRTPMGKSMSKHRFATAQRIVHGAFAALARRKPAARHPRLAAFSFSGRPYSGKIMYPTPYSSMAQKARR